MPIEFEERDATLPAPRVHVGDCIKVGTRGERFWCEVTREPFSDGRIAACVGNDLVCNHWRHGEEIEVRSAHVLEIATLADVRVFRGLLAATGSPEDAALAWRELKNSDRKENTVYLVGKKIV